MRKTLALLLSLAMALSLSVGLFTVGSSAEEAVDYAATKAATLWASATKATTVTIAGVVINSGETKNLADLNGEIFTAGTAAFSDGVLTVTGAAFAEEKSAKIEATAGLSVILNDGSWYGQIHTHNSKAINTPLLVTSNGFDVVGGGNTLRSCSDLVLYGNIGVQVDAGTGYDAMIIDHSAPADTAAELVLGGTRPVVASAAGDGPTVENRRGSITICGNADVTIGNLSDVSTGTPNARALAVTTGAEAGDACISVIDSANLTINTVSGGAIINEGKAISGDSILVDTEGTVKLTASAMYCSGWNAQSSLVYASQGTVRFKKGNVYLNANLLTWTAGANALINSNNAGFKEDTIVIEGTANVVGYHKSSATTNYRFASFWTNGGLMTVKGDASLTLYTDNDKTPDNGNSEYMAFNAKVGGFHVKDNAKVLINGGGSTFDQSSYIRFQLGNYNTAAMAEALAGLVGKCGLQVSGGQLFINFPGACYGVNANDMNTNFAEDAGNFKSSFSFTGGVVVLKNSNATKYSLIGSDPTSAERFGVVSGEVFCSNNDRMGSVWYYFGENAPVTAFDGIDALGLTLTKADLAPFAADGKTFTVPVDGNWKVAGTDTKFKGAAITSGNGVVTAKTGDAITASADLTVAMTKEAPSAEVEIPESTENPAPEVVIVNGETQVALNKDNKTTTGASYDPETGILTIEGLTATGIKVPSGNVIIEVKGTNTITNGNDIEGADAAAAEASANNGVIRIEDGNVTFTGDGTLKVTAKGFNIYVAKGSVTFTDSVKVELEKAGTEGFAAAIYIPMGFKSDDGKVVFAGKSNVKATSAGGAPVRVNAYSFGYGSIEIKDTAVVDLTLNETTSNWSSCAFANKWDISGGTLNATSNISGQQSGSAIAAYADGKNCEDRYATFKMTGGTVNLKTAIDHAKGRPHGLFTNYAKEISFTGGTLNLDITTTGAPEASGEICVQWNGDGYQQAENEYTKVTVSGTAVINANGKSDGLFGISNKSTKADVVISGGTIKGTDQSFIYDRNSKSKLTITGGTIDWTSTLRNVIGATADASKVKFTEGGVGATDKVMKLTANPPSSDVSFAILSVVAVMAIIAAGAVVIVRRKFN